MDKTSYYIDVANDLLTAYRRRVEAQEAGAQIPEHHLSPEALAEGAKLAARYLTLVKRRHVLNKAVRQARRRAAKGNLLWAINFEPPLNVAGEASEIIVRAENLKMKGVPVVFEGSRGCKLEVAREFLEVEYGREFGRIEVIEEYRMLMGWMPGLLVEDPERKWNQLPACREANRRERRSLERAMTAFTRKIDHRTFGVTLECVSLAELLAKLDKPSVVLGYGGGVARLDKQPVGTLWGHGSGLVVLATADLRSIAGKQGDVTSIECDTEGWEGWCDSALVVVKSQWLSIEPAEPKRFAYYQEGQ